MKYIKFYENYSSDDTDVEYILGDYYHDDKCKLIKNNYYKLYRFENLDYYNDACKELDKHELEYKKVLGDDFSYIITQLNQEVIDFLDDKLLSLKTEEDDNYVHYLNNIDDVYTKTYYNKKTGVFWIDFYEIWSLFEYKFGSNYDDTQAITTWYVVTNLHKECSYTVRKSWIFRQ